jgi:serine/threonine protein kinase/tetratricopeptide (TPR) repeat protein
MTGTTLSHYRLLERLGEGATAVVYKAEDLALGRPVALKLLPQTLAVDLGKIARFQHEARTTSTLNHPNICTIYEIDQHEGRHFIVMEYLEGRPLSRVIDGRPIEGYRLIELAIQMADGLAAAHEARVIHRDLKPANIYVTQRDHVKLLDFGLAMLMPSGTLKSASSASWLAEPGGTGPYMSPEQTLGEPLDTRSDLFSLGIVLYEMATGSRPFSGMTHAALIDAIRQERPFPARDMNADVRDELDRIITKALEKNRKLRYQTASDLSADLRRLKRDLDAAPAVVTRPPASVDTIASPESPSDAPIETAVVRKRKAYVGSPWVIAQLLGAAAVGGVLVAFGLPTSRSHDAPPPLDVTRALAGGKGTPAVDAAAVQAPSPPTPVAQTMSSARVQPSESPVLPRSSVNPADPDRAAAATLRGAASAAGRGDGEGREPSSAPRTSHDLAQALRVAESQAGLELYDQALETLREAITADRTSAAVPAAYLLMASIHERRGALKDAIAAYLSVATRYPTDERAPEALFEMADALLKSRQDAREAQAAQAYTDIATKYRTSSWAPRALMARAELEQRRRTWQHDPVLGRPAPAALASYREVVQRHQNSAQSEHALWRLSNLYLDLKRYDLAAENLRELATRYSSSSYDAWFTVAELYDKRLNNPAAARSAYAQVPPTSPRWADAQKRLAFH